MTAWHSWEGPWSCQISVDTLTTYNLWHIYIVRELLSLIVTSWQRLIRQSKTYYKIVGIQQNKKPFSWSSYSRIKWCSSMSWEDLALWKGRGKISNISKSKTTIPTPFFRIANVVAKMQSKNCSRIWFHGSYLQWLQNSSLLLFSKKVIVCSRLLYRWRTFLSLSHFIKNKIKKQARYKAQMNMCKQEKGKSCAVKIQNTNKQINI